MFCTQCGTQLPNASRFCSSCGKPVAVVLEVNHDTSTEQPVLSQNKQLEDSGLVYDSEPMQDLSNKHDEENKNKANEKSDVAFHEYALKRLFAKIADVLFVFIYFPILLGGAAILYDEDYFELILNSIDKLSVYQAWFVSSALFVAYEWVFISLFGATLAKWIFGIKVLGQDDNKLSSKLSFERALLSYLKGLGLGIPVLTLLFGSTAYSWLSKTGTTSWDDAVKSNVYCKKIGVIRTALFVLIPAFMFMTLSLIVSAAKDEAHMVNTFSDAAEYNAAFEDLDLLKENNPVIDNESFSIKERNLGDPEQQLKIGVEYFEGNGRQQDYELASYWINQSAHNGNPYAQAYLGVMFLEGISMEVDHEAAFFWIQSSAKQNVLESQYLLGMMYKNGVGVEPDPRQAFTWFLKASEYGDMDAQYELGLLYFFGIGTQQDKIKAFFWMEKSSDQGNIDAENFIYKNRRSELGLGMVMPTEAYVLAG